MKIFYLSDAPIPSGFGRISGEIFLRLAQRGHEIAGASTLWDGVMPIGVPTGTPLLHPYPFRIAGLAGRDIWTYTANLIGMANPDVVVVCQDFPYAQTLYHNCRLDWSKRAIVNITPIDGEPINPDWLALVDDVDATLVISRFGVEAMRKAGKRVSLCHPGVDTHIFRPADADEKAALRAKAGIAPDAFVVGMAAMNQGRKAIPHTLEGWWEFARDKANAYLELDMDKVGGAGWDIPKLTQHIGIPDGRIIYKEDLVAKGLGELRDRFCIMDAHSVLSHREGFGLPLLESMACRIPTLAMDWCSGTEIVGGGKGFLVRVVPQHRFSTWGNAMDFDPDIYHFAELLNQIYAHPLQAQGVADVGYEWAKQQTWDKAADAVEAVLLQVNTARGKRNHATEQSNGVSGHSGVQPTAASHQTVSQSGPEPAAVATGDSTGGRLLDRDGPARADWKADAGDSQSYEYAIRQDVERGGASGEGGLAPLLEQRHSGDGAVVGADGESLRDKWGKPAHPEQWGGPDHLDVESWERMGKEQFDRERDERERRWSGYLRAARPDLEWESGASGSETPVPAD